MQYKSENGNIVISGQDSFDLCHIFECGQAFRWNKNEDGSYSGVAGKKALTISKNREDIVLYATSCEDFEGFWKNYFDLNTDYLKIKAALSHDAALKTASEFGGGIRILRQDLWESVASFIISANNNISRIKKIVELLCSSFGEELTYMGKRFYTFPTPEKIATLELSDLAVIRAGFRGKYILDAAKKFADGRISEHELRAMPTDAAKKALMTINGVGEKVASCIILFSLSRCESFPVDVWIKRIMEHIYFDGEKTVGEISDFAHKKFADLGGYAQQYLFYYARENKLGF